MLRELEGGSLIVCPSLPRPSFADEILNLFGELSIGFTHGEEVHEIQTALGMVAAGTGVCVIPAASQRQRPDDVCHRIVADEQAASPIVMSYVSKGPTAGSSRSNSSIARCMPTIRPGFSCRMSGSTRSKNEWPDEHSS